MAAKATADLTPAPPPDDVRWIPIKDVHAWRAQQTGDIALAMFDLTLALKQSHLACMTRSRSTGKARPVTAAEWGNPFKLSYWNGRLRVCQPDVRVIARRRTRVRTEVRDLVFYVSKTDLDRLWPAAAAR